MGKKWLERLFWVIIYNLNEIRLDLDLDKSCWIKK